MPEAHLRIVPAKARGHFELTVERLKIAPFQSALCSPQVRICARDRDEPPELHQAAAPEGENCRLNPVAASCVLSVAGAVQVTMRPPPGACASDTLLGG